MVFGIVIGPSLAKFSPQGRAEFFARVGHRFLAYVEIFSILTVIFGVAMVAVIADGDYSLFSPTTTFGLLITVGAALALAAIVDAMVVVVPTVKKISSIAQALLENPGPPPAELPKLADRLKVSSTLAMLLLIVVTVVMVGAATY